MQEKGKRIFFNQIFFNWTKMLDFWVLPKAELKGRDTAERGEA